MCLVSYHLRVMREMEKRGYKPDSVWYNLGYRGKLCEPYIFGYKEFIYLKPYDLNYQEHNDEYLQECLDNLKEKGIVIDPTKI